MKSENIKSALHPRSRHRERYDFDALVKLSPALAPYVQINAYGDASIDFSNTQGVKTLNQALLKQFYAINAWDIPKQYLCPPIPGRADYLHYLADLLSEMNAGVIPRGAAIRVLDIGVGANVIYPLLGTYEYSWEFIGADIDANALENAQKIIDANKLNDLIKLRLQTAPINTQGNTQTSIFKGIMKPGEKFVLTMCNPPFHASLAEAQAGTERKWRGLGKHVAAPTKGSKVARLNFGGQGAELYCAGGELAFVNTMIKESARYAAQCFWFTTLISKATTLPSVYRALKMVNASAVKTIDMAQGQKKSRIVAWTFLEVDPQALNRFTLK